ncbi:MAG: PAS domain S-box protein [Burkholderiales bacterium]|nr:PAS domain S-box protein [Burkholderiales bacterium]
MSFVASVLVCTSMFALHGSQERALRRASSFVRELRQARIDLYQGFMHTMLGGGSDSPWDRARGPVLMAQGIAEFRQVLPKLDDDAFARNVDRELGRFSGLVEQGRLPDAREQVELRVAFARLDGFALEADRQARAQLLDLRSRQSRVFWAVLAASAGLLVVIMAGAVRSLRREGAAVAGQRESELRFRQLADSISEVFWLTDREKNSILYVNPAYATVWGRSPQALMARPEDWLDAVHPDDRERVLGRLPLQPAGGYDEEYRIVRPDGSVCWIRDRAFPVHDARGYVYRIAGVAEDITARKEAERRLRESEARLRLLFDQSPEPVLVHTDGVVTLANEAARRVLGAARSEDLAGLRLLDRFEEASRAQARELLDCPADRPAVQSAAPLPARRLDGAALELEVSTASFERGGRRQMLTILSDVTERRAAQLALRDSERRLRDIIDLVPHAIYAKDPEGRYLLANEATARLFGAAGPGDVVGRRVEDFGLHPADAAVIRRVDLEVLATGQRRDSTATTHWRGGEPVTLAMCKVPFNFAGAEVDSVLGVSTDITWLKKAQDDLKRNVALLRATLQSTDNGMAAAGEDGRLLLWNERLVELAGEAAVVAEGTEAALLACLGWAPDGPGGQATVAQRTDGRFIERHARPMVIDGGVVGRVWSFRDVTARERALADAQSREHELEARVETRTRDLAQAYAELQSFSDAVSHDLRAPLAAVDAFVAALLHQFGEGLNPRARHFLDRVLAASAKMRDMIEGLLELSRHSRAPVHRCALDLTRMVHEAFELQSQALAGRRIELRVQEGLAATGDPALVATLLQNLVGNALKYSRQRDTIRIEVGRSGDGADAHFYVRDNGAGFDPAYADRLFKPFSRLHSESEFEGHGIGLATTSRIAARHGGRIWAEGAPDQGATFRFTLGD